MVISRSRSSRPYVMVPYELHCPATRFAHARRQRCRGDCCTALIRNWLFPRPFLCQRLRDLTRMDQELWCVLTRISFVLGALICRVAFLPSLFRLVNLPALLLHPRRHPDSWPRREPVDCAGHGGANGSDGPSTHAGYYWRAATPAPLRSLSCCRHECYDEHLPPQCLWPDLGCAAVAIRFELAAAVSTGVTWPVPCRLWHVQCHRCSERRVAGLRDWRVRPGLCLVGGYSSRELWPHCASVQRLVSRRRKAELGARYTHQPVRLPFGGKSGVCLELDDWGSLCPGAPLWCVLVLVKIHEHLCHCRLCCISWK
jgi:hypothetical protein